MEVIILLIAAMSSTHSILIALRDGAIGIVLMLLLYKVYDLIELTEATDRARREVE